MNQTVIAFTGISGVGKTTFLRKVAETVVFQHLTGGSLIAAAREASHDDRDKLRHADLDENQRLLSVGFANSRDSETPVIIMDGHVIIDGADGITEIDNQVFADLGVHLIVHLEAEPSRIFENRAGDDKRDRPVTSVDVLRVHQERSRQRAQDVTNDLGIDFIRVTHSDSADFADLIALRAAKI
jgi:adenylate kinase